MKGAILTFERYLGKRNIGSSRIRGKWLADNWEGVELFTQGQGYDFIIYQKAYFVEHAKAFKGIKIFDLCDPDFLHWGYRTKEMLDNVDIITTSTEALAKTLRNFTTKPVVHIPDRINLKEFTTKKYHKDRARTVVWYGYSTNFEMLKPVLHFIKKLKLNLIVISDTSFLMPNAYVNSIEVRNFPHNWDTVALDIQEGDIVINPQSSKGKWKYKSNNKTLFAWAQGMPVATNLIELQKFLSEEERRKEAIKRTKELEEKWDICYSVNELKTIIKDVKKQKI